MKNYWCKIYIVNEREIESDMNGGQTDPNAQQTKPSGAHVI